MVVVVICNVILVSRPRHIESNGGGEVFPVAMVGGWSCFNLKVVYLLLKQALFIYSHNVALVISL